MRAGTVVSLAALAAITIVAAHLRLHGLGDRSFWMDESVTAAFMRLDWFNLVRLWWRREANMAFYVLLLRGWVSFGNSEAWYRGFSVLWAVATIPALYAVGKRLFGRAMGLTAAGLLAVNAYHVRYSQEARSYALVVFLLTLSSYFLVRAVETGRKSDWTWYVVLSTLAVYSHFFAVLVVVAHWVALRLAFPRNQGSQAPPALAGDRGFIWAAKRIGWATLLIWIFIATTGVGLLRWLHRPGIAELQEMLRQFSGNGDKWLVWLYVLCTLLAVLAALQAWWRHGRSLESWRYAVVLSWMIVPLAITLTVTLVRPVFLPRYLIIILPALVLAVAAGLETFRYRWISLPVLAAIVWLAAGGIHAYYERDFDLLREDYRGMTAYALEHAAPGDAILFYPNYNRCGYEYYAGQPGRNSAARIIAPGNHDRMVWRDFMGKVSPQVLDRATLDYRRVWVVLSNNSGGTGGDDAYSQQIKSTLGRRYRLAETRNFRGLSLYRYEP